MSWFPGNGESTEPAKAVRGRCLVRDECAAFADSLPGPLEGVWAGLSAKARRRARREAA